MNALAILLIDDELSIVMSLAFLMRKNGCQVCRQLRQRPERAATKVIFLSAKNQPADVQKGYDAGADLYIPKPFSTRQLMQKVREILGKLNKKLFVMLSLRSMTNNFICDFS